MPFVANNLNWLARNSSLVFVGKLANQTSEKDNRDLIITRNVFDIERAIRGSYGRQQITLNTLGGTAGGVTMAVAEMPVFRRGLRYVVFTDPERTTYNPITGNQAGVFIVGPDNAVYGYGGLVLTNVSDGILQFGERTLKDALGPNARAAGHPGEPKGTMIGVAPARPGDVSVVTLDQFVRVIEAIPQGRANP